MQQIKRKIDWPYVAIKMSKWITCSERNVIALLCMHFGLMGSQVPLFIYTIHKVVVHVRLLHNSDRNVIKMKKDDAPNGSHSTTGQTIKIKAAKF